jgi:hypothetical protein
MKKIVYIEWHGDGMNECNIDGLLVVRKLATTRDARLLDAGVRTDE